MYFLFLYWCVVTYLMSENIKPHKERNSKNLLEILRTKYNNMANMACMQRRVFYNWFV